ncbi:MAG: hypothetical protein ACLSAP_09795 [Oscillospiraceae bacterium]
MPNIYLSPSTQEYNMFVDSSGSEEYYMNLIADAMEPYLRSSGIRFTRNTPDMTAASSIQQSNEGNYDLHLALHSNAAPENLAGKLQGTDVYYYPGSVQGQRAAEIIANNLKAIYPNPSLVKAVTTTRLGEAAKRARPACWIICLSRQSRGCGLIINNIQSIARNVVLSLTEFFNIPFVEPQLPRTGTVRVRPAEYSAAGPRCLRRF